MGHVETLVQAARDPHASDADTNRLDVLLRVIDLLPNPVYIKDREHRWVEVNSAFCDFLGYPRETLLGKSDFDFNPRDQARVFWQMDDAVFSTQKENVNLEQTTNKGGETLWVESKKSYYKSDDGEEFIIGVLTDVTQMKAREAALEQAEKEALAGAEAKTTFLANMSHEIRTPMNGVLGMAQVLRSTTLSDNQSEMVDTLERSGEVLLRLIDDILDFSKLDAGQMSICIEPFNLRDAVEDVSALLGVAARDKGLDLIVEIDPNLPTGVEGDRDRINQILTNLIGNAVKFTETGYVRLKVDGRVKGGQVALDIRVADTGIGIAPEKLVRIFEKFQQADGSTTRIYGGTGLGLAISKELTEVMGGSLKATSTPGEGAEFHLKLSLPISDVIARVPALKIDNVALSRLKILAVDDIALNLNIVKAQLSRLSLTADIAGSAEDAVRMLSAAANEGAPYNLLLTDYQMPKIDGLELAGSLRKHPSFRDLQIVVMSSVNDTLVRQAFIGLDVAGYLVKPVRLQEFHRAISEASLQV